MLENEVKEGYRERLIDLRVDGDTIAFDLLIKFNELFKIFLCLIQSFPELSMVI